MLPKSIEQLVISATVNMTADATLVTTSRNMQARRRPAKAQSNGNTAQKHGYTFKDHRWQDCRKIKRDQQRKQKQTAKPQHKQQNPATAQSNSHGLIAQAYTSNKLSHVNNSTYTWKFDICASMITKNLVHMVNIRPLCSFSMSCVGIMEYVEIEELCDEGC